MPPHPPSTRRRTTLGVALLGLVAVAGCDLDDLDPRSEPAPSVDPTPSAPAQDADAALVDGVVAELSAALAAAAAVGRPDRADFRPLVRLHRRHLAELEADGAEPAAGPRGSASEVLQREQQLQQRLVEAAVAAGSGELARVLASMSAAVAQQLAVLPVAPATAQGAP